MPKKSSEPIFNGVELIVRKGNKILLGLRKNCYGAGTWGFPSGHLEYGERLDEGACREALEELGANILPNELNLVALTENIYEEHHVHHGFELRNPKWEPKNMEPNLCEEWRYFDIDKLPENFFEPHQNVLDNYLAGKIYQ